jgi:coniferyl-aldehyde dehydrogenase
MSHVHQTQLFLLNNKHSGGVGQSGLGHYHGHEGFKAMSKAKTVLKRGKFYPGKWTAPPYSKSIIKPALNWLLRT